MRNWVVNNPFFQTKGQFSKTAFICMSTWVTVILKYITSGMTFALSTTEKVVAGKVIPALSWQWAIAFDPSAAIGLLTIVFGLYFGNKFSPGNKNGEGVQENQAITK